MPYQRGEVIYVPFQYSELSGGKSRVRVGITLNVDRARMDLELPTREDAAAWVTDIRRWAENRVRAAEESEQTLGADKA